jgi:NAD(P)-dependent dehydrogenase (short-subunit alcohol dehydrogenase family)
MAMLGTVGVVTGAGSGIGRALCSALAQRGVTIAACDIHADSARETVGALAPAQGSARHRAFAVDVSDRKAVNDLARAVVDGFGRVDILVNNAGILGQVAPLEMLSDEEMDRIIGIDLWGVIHGTRAFLPHLKQRTRASLVNVSSIAGFMGTIGNSAYFAAKAGVRGFSEAIRSECQPTGVAVTVVFPGIVKTNLGASGYPPEQREEAIRLYNAKPGATPEKAAASILRAIERGKPRLLIGPDAWFADKLVRLVPARFDRIGNSLVRKMANASRPDGRAVF